MKFNLNSLGHFHTQLSWLSNTFTEQSYQRRNKRIKFANMAIKFNIFSDYQTLVLTTKHLNSSIREYNKKQRQNLFLIEIMQKPNKNILFYY